MRWILLFILFFPISGLSQESGTDFLDGIKAFEAKELEKAQELFTPLYQEHPDNPSVLFNLGLVEYQMGNPGLALGLWRKALSVDSRFLLAKQAIEYAEEKLFPDKGNVAFYVMIFRWLANLPHVFWLILSILSLLAGAWFALEYGVKNKVELGHWPTWIHLMAPIFVFSTFFALYQAQERSTLKATVIEKNLQTRANPSENSPTLSELDEGQIVIVEKTHGSWAQIKTLSGNPGWVPQTSLIGFKGI